LIVSLIRKREYTFPLSSIRGPIADELVAVAVLKFESLGTVEEISCDNWIFLLSRCDAGKVRGKAPASI
jgi:hypothetical protein